MSDKLTVVAIPPATANGPLHVGHLSGPYVACDIAARAARAQGARVLVTAGVDIHQNYVLLRSQQLGVPAEKMVGDFKADILETFRLIGIGYDHFIDPLDPGHEPSVDRLVRELLARGALHMAEVTLQRCDRCERTLHHSYVVGRCSTCGAVASGGTCEGCGGYTSAQDLIDVACAVCGGPPTAAAATVPVLRLEDYRPQLTELWQRTEIPPRVRRLVARYSKAPLPQVPVAYPTDWGTAGTQELSGLRIDGVVEVALTEFYGTARTIDPCAATLDDYLRAWSRVGQVWNVHGIDNAFIFAITWPALWAAAGLDPVPHAGQIVNEFYTLDGSKFSTSRDHAIWANDMLRREDPAIVRLYLAWDRPDRHGSDFTWAAYEAFRDRVMPLLKGAPAVRPLAPALAAAERTRGWEALRLANFSPPLAARCLLALLEAGETDDRLMSALAALPAGSA